MERRRRVHSNGFDALTAEQQVQYVIDNWKSMFPIATITEEEKREECKDMLSPDIDDYEYFDDYYFPMIEEDMKGTEFERYYHEILHGLSSLFLYKY